jgi:hypothetical protein
MQPVRVKCRSDFQYAQQPIALEWAGLELRVERVINRWTGPQGNGFEVQAGAGRCFRLQYHEAEDGWLGEEILAG